MPRRREDLLNDIVEFARETLWHLEGVDIEEFLEDKGLQRIIERTLELIGEAARQLGPERPDIGVNWEAINGLRVLLAHVYTRIEPARLYDTATLAVPDLLVKVQRYLDEQDGPPSRRDHNH